MQSPSISPMPTAISAERASREQQTARLLPQAATIATCLSIMVAIGALRDADAARIVREAPVYALQAMVPLLAVLLYRKGRLSGLATGLVADTVLTVLLLARLAVGQATLSGTVLFLVLKIVGTALLFPWGGWIQLGSAATSTLLYWLCLWGRGEVIVPYNWVHQVFAPVIATLLSAAGAALSASTRREYTDAATQLALSLAQTQRAESDKAGLLEISRDTSGTVDLQEVVQRLQGHTAVLLRCDTVATFVTDPDGQSFRVIDAYGPAPNLRAEAMAMAFPRKNKAMEPLDAGRSLIVDPTASLGLVEPGILERFGIRHLIVAPLRVANRFFGGLVAVRRSADDAPFDAHDVALLEGVASQLALAIEVIELYRKSQDDADTSRLLAQLARELIEAVGTPNLMPILCERTREALGCDVTVAYLRGGDPPRYNPQAASGLPTEEWEMLRSLSLPVQTPEASYTLEVGVWQSGTPEHPQTLGDAFATRYGITQLMRLPLRHGADLVGVLTASYRGRREPFSERQVQIAKSIAQLASLAWHNTQLIEQLEQANRLQADFVATMSHELRTPINIIHGYTDLLINDEFGPLTSEQRDTLQRVTRSSEELVELVNTTLQISRMDSGYAPIEQQSLAIGELVREAVADTKELWDRVGLAVVVDIDGTTPAIVSDRPKLKVILKNLIGNAAKFTERGEIRITTKSVDDGVQVSVRDTGVGIAADALPIIFERFRQADASMTRRFGGVGLGLYIVRRLLNIIGGRVHVESVPGQGSTFSVWVPLSRGDASLATPITSPRSATFPLEQPTQLSSKELHHG